MERSFLVLALSSTLLFLALGCAQAYYPPPPSSPPPPIAQESTLVQFAERKGFTSGRSDGEADANRGAPARPRHSRAFRHTPGYDPQLGPFPIYRDAFRDAYIRGYRTGYNRS
jgi:hypothetical protein